MTQSTTRRPIRIGVQLRQQHTSYQAYADAVRRAEDLGLDTIWDWDHFFPLTGDPQGIDVAELGDKGGHLTPWSLTEPDA